MPNIVNRIVSKELQSELGEANGMVFVSFGGLTVSESEDLRGKLAEKGVKIRMVRNSLARRVLADRGLEFDKGALVGNVAIAYGDAEAAINAAKILTEKEVKKAGKVKLKAGLLDGEVLAGQDAHALADVPDKDTLRAMMLGALSGPARALVTIFDANQSSIARVLQAHADQEEA